MIDRPMQVTQLLKESLGQQIPITLGRRVVSSEVDLAEPKYQKCLKTSRDGSYDVLECLNNDLMVFVDA